MIWDELRSGVVDVSAAITFIPPMMAESTESPKSTEIPVSPASPENPYQHSKRWREKEETERLAALMGEDEEEAAAVLLSYLSEDTLCLWQISGFMG